MSLERLMSEKTWKSSWVRCSVVQMALLHGQGRESLWCSFGSSCCPSGRKGMLCLLVPGPSARWNTCYWSLQIEICNLSHFPCLTFNSLGCKAPISIICPQSSWKEILRYSVSIIWCLLHKQRVQNNCLQIPHVFWVEEEGAQVRWAQQKSMCCRWYRNT